MREPFTGLLPRGERLLAAGETELGSTTGPLAMPAEMLALFSPIIGVVLFLQLDGTVPKLLGLVLPPLLLIVLARYPLRRWHRPREWVGMTDQRLLIWRRRGSLRASPRIEEISLGGLEGVELVQDDWDRRRGTHHVTLHTGNKPRALGRIRAAEPLRDAIVRVGSPVTPVTQPPPSPPPLTDFIPPSGPREYRPQ